MFFLLNNRLKKNISIILLAFIAVLLCVYFFTQKAQEQTVATSTDYIMNTVVEQKLFGKNAQTAIDEIRTQLIEMESKLSMHIDTSEISQINKNAGKAPVKVSDDVFEILKRAKSYSEQSDGIFDITIAPLTSLWNITSDSPSVPAQSDIDEALSKVGYENLILNEEEKTAYLTQEGAAIDLGGVAKGIAGEKVMQIAKENGIKSGYVSIGGNLTVIGKKPQGEDFYFGIRDPRGDASEYIAKITLPDKIMATSGDYERYFIQDSKRYHHILDTSNGYPSESDLISVSVISEDGGLTDFLSTTFFVAGKETTLKYMNEDKYSLVIVDKDKNVYYSQSLEGIIEPNSEKSDYVFHCVRN